MKKFTVLVLVLMSVLLIAAPAQAQKPVWGDMYLEFNLAWPGPSTTIPDWTGTVTINGVEYGMLFFNFWSGKPFDFPFKGSEKHPVIFFGERWEIYDMVTGGLLLMGYDEGVTTSVNSKFRMNGFVAEAFGVFAGLEGRNVHMSGTYTSHPFGAPHIATGPFRIN
jgi:hypothetical protein